MNRKNEDLHGTEPGSAPKSLVCSVCPAGYPTLHVLGHQISRYERRNPHSRGVATSLSSKSHVTNGTQQLPSRIAKRASAVQNACLLITFRQCSPPVSSAKVP